MGRTKTAGKIQAARLKRKELCKEIMGKVGERKGLLDYCDSDVAALIGVSPGIYSRIKKDGLLDRKFDTVLKLVDFAGYELKLEKIETAPKNIPISAKKGDTYGAIIEGLIRRIVQESMENARK